MSISLLQAALAVSNRDEHISTSPREPTMTTEPGSPKDISSVLHDGRQPVDCTARHVRSKKRGRSESDMDGSELSMTELFDAVPQSNDVGSKGTTLSASISATKRQRVRTIVARDWPWP